MMSDKKTYTYDEVRAESIKYFKGDELAAEVFAGKYALRDMGGKIYELTPTDMHKRLAKEFARIELKYDNPMSEDEIFDLLSSWKIVPQGSPMSAMGNPFQIQSLSNCFVIDSPQDSYGGILLADQRQSQIMKRRGGVGFDISNIRPKGLTTSNAARTTDGIGVFMERFSNTCREVAQGGRRGALMLSISVHHPEIKTFINIKKDLKKVTGANISIRLSDEFMNAVKNETKVQLRFPVDKDVKHTIEQEIDAIELWNEIIEAAHHSAEPGLLFWDTITRMCPADAYISKGYNSISTNPCAELNLSAFDSCRLLLVNLYKFVKNPFTKKASFDYDEFNKIAYKAQRLMDDLVDLELEAVDAIINKIKSDPESEEVKAVELSLWQKIRISAEGGRRTGLGITALGDTLAACNIQYGSQDSIDVTEKIYKTQALAAYRSTVDMAKERGTFPVFSHELELNHPFIDRIMACDSKLKSDYEKYGRRNIALTTTAPAGSVSILTQTTSGCEPAFMLFYKRRRKITASDGDARVDFTDNMGDKWQEYTVYHHAFKKWMEVTGLTEDDVAKSPYHGATSNDINWVKKIDVQAGAQKWVCHSISNTTNIPNETSVDVVKQIYMHGWVSGCKGVTIYRDGSRAGVLVSNEPEKKIVDEFGQPLEIMESHAPKRPKKLSCDIHRTTIKGETYLVLVGLHNDKPYEIFCGLQQHVEVPKKIKSGTLIKNGKVDGIATYNLKIPLGDDDEIVFNNVVELFQNPIYGALTRTISLAMRHGVPLQFLVEQLKKDKHSDITSFSSVIARVLSKQYIVDGTKSTSDKTCSECGENNLQYMQGCVTCFSCGAGKCG
jgi:ribonucleoside-diphosphate reductase alpha chain